MKKGILFFLVLVLMLGVLALASAEESTGKVTVTILDAVTGEPVPKCPFTIWRMTGISPSEDSDVVFTQEEYLEDFRTNAKGKKSVRLEPGVYEILLLDLPDNYVQDDSSDVKFVVYAGKTVKQKVLLSPTMTCRIKVLDAEGQPKSGAQVRICNQYAVANEKGIAILKNVPVGKDSIRVTVNKNYLFEYLAWNGQIRVKGEQGGTFKKTIRLPKESEWEQIVSPIVEAKKPVLYLYSSEEREVRVRLGYPENLTASYPAYPAETGWQVQVHPDGSMTDLATGRDLYSLYWEGKTPDLKLPEEGFVVAGPDTASFLEEKLAILGLNEREAEEFIIYWLPVLQRNAYNLIRFATPQAIEEAMPLALDPAPDAVIRVWMAYEPLEQPIPDLPEQTLLPVDREALQREAGLLVVEWGGMDF